jgi:hypothetical protein
MQSKSERGEGRLSTFVWLIVLVGIGYAGWNLVPAFMTNYNFKDKLNQLARSPRGTTSDEKIMDLIWSEIREDALDPYLGKQNCRITTLETSRRISCVYDREIQLLPGWKRVFHFVDEVDQPLLF